jgi:hypothetical protein
VKENARCSWHVALAPRRQGQALQLAFLQELMYAFPRQVEGATSLLDSEEISVRHEVSI